MDRLVPRYEGSYATDYDGVIEIVNAHEYLHGNDRISGAFRSLLSLYDDACAWVDFYKSKVKEDE